MQPEPGGSEVVIPVLASTELLNQARHQEVESDVVESEVPPALGGPDVVIPSSTSTKPYKQDRKRHFRYPSDRSCTELVANSASSTVGDTFPAVAADALVGTHRGAKGLKEACRPKNRGCPKKQKNAKTAPSQQEVCNSEKMHAVTE